jgi:opacity protein-like surface antigen
MSPVGRVRACAVELSTSLVRFRRFVIVKKSFVLLVCFSAFLLAPVAAHAQTSSVTVFSGIVNGIGIVEETVTKPVLGATVVVPAGPVAVEGDFAWWRDGVTDGAAEVSSNFVTLMGGVRKSFPTGTIVEPYAAGGLGLIRVSYDLDDIGAGSDSESQFGFNVGGGAVVRLSESLGVQGELRYLHAIGADEGALLEGEGFVRVTGGITFVF